MDDERMFYYLLALRMYVHILAMYAAGFFFLDFILRKDYERRSLNKRALTRYESQSSDLNSIGKNTSVRIENGNFGLPPKRQCLAQVATRFLENFDSKMDVVISDLAKIAHKLPDPSESDPSTTDLIEQVKKLGLTEEEEEIDLIVKFAHNQQYEKFFWEFQGPQRMSFVMKIMRM